MLPAKSKTRQAFSSNYEFIRDIAADMEQLERERPRRNSSNESRVPSVDEDWRAGMQQVLSMSYSTTGAQIYTSGNPDPQSVNPDEIDDIGDMEENESFFDPELIQAMKKANTKEQQPKFVVLNGKQYEVDKDVVAVGNTYYLKTDEHIAVNTRLKYHNKSSMNQKKAASEAIRWRSNGDTSVSEETYNLRTNMVAVVIDVIDGVPTVAYSDCVDPYWIPLRLYNY